MTDNSVKNKRKGVPLQKEKNSPSTSMILEKNTKFINPTHLIEKTNDQTNQNKSSLIEEESNNLGDVQLLSQKSIDMKVGNRSQTNSIQSNGTDIHQTNEFFLANDPPQQIENYNISMFSSLNCEDLKVRDYFNQFIQTDQQNTINAYQNDIFSNLKNELSIGSLTIQKTRPFPLKKNQKNHLQKEREMKQKLEQKRQQALQKIKEIQQQQLQLKRRVISTIQRPKRNSQLSLLVQLPEPTDKTSLKKALKEYKKFTQEMQKRSQTVKQQQQQQHLLELQKQSEIMKLRRQSKREEIKQNLRQIMERERIRKSIMDEWKEKQTQIKNKKYLYIDYKNKDKQQEELKANQNQRMLERIRQSHRLDQKEIQEHRKKYEELLVERKQLSKSLSFSNLTNKSQHKKYQTSKFHEFVMKEIEENKKKELQRIMKVKENQHKEKILLYRQKVDNEIKPNLRLKKFVPLPRSMSVDALAPEQQRQLGLKYLQKAKKLKMPQNKLKLSQIKKESQQKLKLSRSKNSYKDYLQQIKKDIKYDPTQKKLDEILRKRRSFSNYQALKDAKYLSEYLVEKSRHTGQKKTMLQIRKKMDILNSIY